MALESITVFAVIPADAQTLYEAWLDGARHTAFTGGAATVEPGVGGAFTAWDGYITGRTLELEPARRIVQAWRTGEFPEGSDDSRLEIELEPVDGGTRVTLRHSDIPEGQGARYEQGWEDHYFVPMRAHFGAGASKPAAPKRAAAKKGAKKAAKRAAAKKGTKRGGAKKKSAGKRGTAKKGVKKGGAKKGAKNARARAKGARRR